MVTNLPAEAKAKFAKYMDAKTPEEKLRALEEFLSSVPKHKGTENLVRWARRRMAELREEIDERKKKKSGGGISFFVEKEGAAQVVIIGLTKVGKSSFLKVLTNANVQVSDVPYTTKFPAVGMLHYEDIQFQLVESPAIIPEGGGWNTKVVGLAKNSDGIVLMLDASRDVVDDFLFIKNFLEEHGLYIEKPKGYVNIERKYGGGIRIINYGKLLCTEEDIAKLLNSYRIYHAVVKVYGEIDIDDVERSIYETTIYKPTIIVVNKIDLDETLKSVELLRSILPNDIPMLAVSTLYRIGLENIGSTIFKALDLIRIYTKPPLGKPSDKPLVVKKGTTVLDVAKIIHKELYEKFAYARIWGTSAKYPGQRVGADHILEDRDIVEINTKK
ncbi:MAG: TGS domain-containing protein [Ignisphaera sp.]|uniref:TGS domain-containing protein n=1 Tax=Ignisphaera aggregans TaxID=334771 RepID=A0A7C4D3Z7_9CREN